MTSLPSFCDWKRFTCRAGMLGSFAALLWAPPAVAQERVGLLVRGGTTVAGELEDLSNGTLYVRVSLHDQRRIPIGDVLMMDLTADRPLAYYEEIDAAAGPHQLLVLRDGRRIRGTLLAIEGGRGSSKEDQPRVLTFGPLDGPAAQFETRGVARVYLVDFAVNRPAAQPPPSPPVAPAPAGAVQVPANVRWVSANIVVQQGETVAFAASGRVQLSGDASDVATPGGSSLGRMSPAATMPGVLVGALLGRIGVGQPFGIGDQTVLRMPASGELFLGVNDDSFNDNRAAFQVVVTRTPR